MTIPECTKNPHATFLSDLSEDVGLETRYNNHLIRVTGVMNLTCGHYTPCQIMSITGHKSMQSLAIYQHVKEDEKMMMGMSLMYSLLIPTDVARVIRENEPISEIKAQCQAASNTTPVLMAQPWK